MSSSAKIGLLVLLVIVGVMGAYFAFGPGADEPPTLQVNASQADGAGLSAEVPRGEPASPVEPPSQMSPAPRGGRTEGPLTETVRERLTASDQRTPFVIINRLPGESSRQDVHPVTSETRGGTAGTLIGTDLPPIPPGEELLDHQTGGGKDGWTPPAEEETTEFPVEPEIPAPAPPRTDPLPPAPASPRPGISEYVVQAGDNFWSIAERWFGDGTKHHLIAAANPGVESSKLKIGQTLKLPPKDAAGAAPPTGGPATGGGGAPPDGGSSTYKVQPGDTLVSIARRLLGDDSKWKQLYEANRRAIGDNPDILKAGVVLTIPR